MSDTPKRDGVTKRPALMLAHHDLLAQWRKLIEPQRVIEAAKLREDARSSLRYKPARDKLRQDLDRLRLSTEQSLVMALLWNEAESTNERKRSFMNKAGVISTSVPFEDIQRRFLQAYPGMTEHAFWTLVRGMQDQKLLVVLGHKSRLLMMWLHPKAPEMYASVYVNKRLPFVAKEEPTDFTRSAFFQSLRRSVIKDDPSTGS